jgi:hypothetical protein
MTMTDPVEEQAYRWPRWGLLLLTASAIIALIVLAFLVMV